MLLLTGIFPKLNSDPVRDTTCVYKCVKSLCLDVRPGLWGLVPSPPGTCPGTRHSAYGVSTARRRGSEGPHTPEGTGWLSVGLSGFGSLKPTVWVGERSCLPSRFKGGAAAL